MASDVTALCDSHGFIWFFRPEIKAGAIAYCKDSCTIAEIEAMLVRVRQLAISPTSSAASASPLT